jgi:hypothetical protein
MPDRLSIYNGALRKCKSRRLATLNEDIEARYLLDNVWNDDLIGYVLEQGFWRFATRTSKLDQDTSVATQFGYSYTFTLPDDFVKLVQISANEYFDPPLNEYTIEGDIYADIDPLYLRYVSSDESYGSDLSRWPRAFTRWVEFYLATEIAPTLTNDVDMAKLEESERKAFMRARSNDAIQDPTRFAPQSSWARSRWGGHIGNRERGSRSSLTG